FYRRRPVRSRSLDWRWPARPRSLSCRVMSERRRRLWVGWLGVGVALLAVTGCESAAGPLAPVRGRVTYKGVPLRAGSIVFTPDAHRGNSGPLARGEIQSDGTYVLSTDDGRGAVSGWHRVTIVAVEPAGTPAPGEVFAVPRALL